MHWCIVCHCCYLEVKKCTRNDTIVLCVPFCKSGCLIMTKEWKKPEDLRFLDKQFRVICHVPSFFFLLCIIKSKVTNKLKKINVDLTEFKINLNHVLKIRKLRFGSFTREKITQLKMWNGNRKIVIKKCWQIEKESYFLSRIFFTWIAMQLLYVAQCCCFAYFSWLVPGTVNNGKIHKENEQ